MTKGLTEPHGVAECIAICEYSNEGLGEGQI